MNASLPPVSLIVLNYNGRSFLDACLNALLALDYSRFSVTVIDNASTDDSVEFVRDYFPQVHLITSRENLGFAGGNNIALRQLQTEFAALINPDVIVAPDWLQQLMVAVLADETIGIAGCKLYYPGDQHLQHAGGYLTHPQALSGHYGLNEEDWGQYDAMRDVDYVIGAAMLIRQRVLDEIGLLDEGFFLYYEDVDLCTRVSRAGYRVVYVPQARGTHLESAVAGKNSSSYLQYMHTSRWRYLLKHFDLKEILSVTIEAEKKWLLVNAPTGQHANAAAYRTTLDRLPDIWQARLLHGAGQVTAEQSGQIQAALQELLQYVSRLTQSSHWTPQQVGRYNTQTVTQNKRMSKLKESSTDGTVPPSEADLLPPEELGSQVNHPYLSSLLEQLRTRREVKERPFVSHIPILGPFITRFRWAWNNISTTWYVRPLIEQQNDFNYLLVQCLQAVASQQADLNDRLAVQAHEQAVCFKNIAELDDRLIEQDREQTVSIKHIAELTTQLVQMNRLLYALSQRLTDLEAEQQPDKPA